MPKIIAISETRRSLREVVADQLAKMKPGDAVVLMDWAPELNCTPEALARAVPRENRTIARVTGYPHPVALMQCLPSAKPRATTSKR